MEQDPSDTRIRQEAAFHDARIHTPDEQRLSYGYASVADVYAATHIPPECMDQSVLEIGCFRGDEARRAAAMTGQYVGIDISSAAIEFCKKQNFPANFRFDVDDANVLSTVADNSVDYAFGNGVLHHLDLEQFSTALAKKLTRNASAKFIEPAQGNFALRLFRKLTPNLRTADEHPFDEQSMAVLRKHFTVKVQHHGLLRPFVPMLFLNAKFATDFSRWADRHILQWEALQSQAWLLCIELRPK